MLSRLGSIMWNATPLLTPLTGVGQYTLQLIRAVAKIASDNSEYKNLNLIPFYGRRWHKISDLQGRFTAHWDFSDREQLAPSIIRLWRQYVGKFPGSRYLLRKYQSVHFVRACKQFENLVYHEPHCIAFPFEGPTIVTVHDLSFIRYPETHPHERAKFLQDNILGSLCRADRIITVSHFVKKEIEYIFGTSIARKASVIYNGVAADYYPRSEDELQPLFQSRGVKHRQFILTVGTLEPRKNLITLIRAYVNLPTRLKQLYPLLIAGPKGWGTSALQAELNRYRAESIHWLGFVSATELPLLYAAARVFVYPSLYEGFGLPVVEAMASGVPVITSNAQALCEVLGNAGLTVSSHDVEGFRYALESLLNDPIGSEKLASAGISVARKFSWEQSAWQHLGCYEGSSTIN